MAQTIAAALLACGANINNNPFGNQNNDERMAEDIFGNDFATCIDKTFEDLDTEFKGYSDLTQAQGQIRLLPGTKRKIKAFVQWVKEQYRLGRDPQERPRRSSSRSLA